MEHRLGHFELVRWQGSKSRRLKPKVSITAMLLLAAGVVGLALMGAQALGGLHLSGLSALLPGTLLLLASTGPLLAFFRGALAWVLG
jgi:hypothetical protein